MQTAQDELARVVAAASDTPTALAAIDEWGSTTATREPIGDAIFVSTMLAYMAGQLMVRGREATTVQLATPDVTAFLDQPWVVALREFKKRGLVSPREFETLIADYAQRSDAARTLLLEQIQKKMRAALIDAIAQGQTLREFSVEVQSNLARVGVEADDPSYLENVFRTNVQSAYGAGRFRAITSPEVMAARPYVQYRTVGDARVRDEHRVLDGLIFRTDDPTWNRIAPPNGFRCRCAIVTLSEEDRGRASIATEIPAEFEADPGFDGPPVARL